MSIYGEEFICKPGRLDIDQETAVTWNPDTGEVTSLHVGFETDQPAGVALSRLKDRFKANAAELKVLQQCAEALMRQRMAEPGAVWPPRKEE